MSASTDRPTWSRMHEAAPTRASGPTTTGSGPSSRTLALLIIAVIGLAILPNLVNYLNVQHAPQLLDDLLSPIGASAPRSQIAHVARLAASAVLFFACCVIALMPGHRNRSISGTMVILLALIFPYITSPDLPDTIDIVSILIGAAVVLAVWNIGASVDALKWVSITGSLIAAYSIIGGLINPDYMMYYLRSTKALIGNWQLAGPFSHANALGVYCALALALLPLIVSVRWRLLNGLILCTAIVASASRTALIAMGVLALWWGICWLRSVISVRVAGTALSVLCATTVLVLPLLNWDQEAFSGRAYIWAQSLSAWQESPFFGLGVTWYTTAAASSANIASWAYVGSGHNLAIDTLVASGLMGLCILGLILLAAIRSVRALDTRIHQIACFGYLIAFLVASMTEAVWTLLPNLELFPVTGLVFAVLIVTRHDAQPDSPDTLDS